ncbi:MAG: protein kinase [Myxococcales bacterium]|nr:protein kinase [Myxococcales bacterium]
MSADAVDWGRADLIRDMVRHFLLRSGAAEDDLDSLFNADRDDLDGLIARLRERGLLESGEARIITGVWRGYLKGPLAALMPSFSPGQRRVPTPVGGRPSAPAAEDSASLPAPPLFGTLPTSSESQVADALELVTTPTPSRARRTRRDASSRASAAAAKHVLGATIGPYTIDASLGRDRWSELYRARRDGDQTALVRVLRTDAPDAVARTLRVHTPAMLKLRHPSVLTPIAGGTLRGRPYLVYPFVVGLNLRDQLEIVEHLAPRALAVLATGLVDGLAAAHACGLTHGNVRPAHVLFDGDALVKLTGFGFSPVRHARFGESPTLTDALYSAPEQLERGEPLDHRADMYGLGATLYHAAVGRAPFTGAGVHDPIRARLDREPIPVEVVAPEFPSLLSHWIGRLLRRRPDDRFSGWEDARAALRHVTRRALEGALEGRS